MAKEWLKASQAAQEISHFMAKTTFNKHLKQWWLNPDERFPKGEVRRTSKGLRGHWRISREGLDHFINWCETPDNVNATDVQ